MSFVIFKNHLNENDCAYCDGDDKVAEFVQDFAEYVVLDDESYQSFAHDVRVMDVDYVAKTVALNAEKVLANNAELIRAKRDDLLLESDWMAMQDRTMSQAEKDYRQALRDVTNQSTFPDSVVWPTL